MRDVAGYECGGFFVVSGIVAKLRVGCKQPSDSIAHLGESQWRVVVHCAVSFCNGAHVGRNGTQQEIARVIYQSAVAEPVSGLRGKVYVGR